MQLTIFTDYGLRSLMYLAAQPAKTCSVREISEHFGVSRNHLVKVVHRLAQLGYVTSSKGKGGGIRLAQPADTLKVGDLVRKLEPNMHLVECFDRVNNTCRVISACDLQHMLHKANRAFLSALNDYTLADAVKNRSLFIGTAAR